MALPKYLSTQDIEYIKQNTHLTASELSRLLNKPRSRIAKLLKEIKGVVSLGTKSSIYSNLNHQQYILENYKTKTLQEMLNYLGYGSIAAISRYILKNIDNTPRNPGIKKSKEFYQCIIDNYGEIPTPLLSKMLNINSRTLSYHKNKLGLETIYVKRTTIEVYTEDFLKSQNILFKSEYIQDKYRFDFYLPLYNCFIEVQGDYWHCNPEIYPNGPLTDVQVNNLERDANKFQYCVDNGFNIIFIWEKDIKDNILNLNNFYEQKIMAQIALLNCEI